VETYELVERYPEVLQPLFVAGFDAELSRLLVDRPTGPAGTHVATLAGFRFPTHQVTPQKVAELREVDEFQTWWQSLQIALLNVDAEVQGLEEAHAYVHEVLTPAAHNLMKSLESHVWRDVRRTGIEKMVIGTFTSLASSLAGGAIATSVASGVAGIGVSAAYSAMRGRGRNTKLDVPFLSMSPDTAGWDQPTVIPTLGPLF
jgi:hypothetical protein